MLRRYAQICRPDRASMAHAVPLKPVTYSTLSTSSGVVWKFGVSRVWNVHCALSWLTFCGVICVSGL